MKQNAFILGVATAVPAISFTQEQFISFFTPILGLSETNVTRMHKLAENMAIITRHTVIEDLNLLASSWTFFNAQNPIQFPSTMQRNEIYKREAPKLAEHAALKVIAQWGRPAQEITHVIVVSCTGFMAPGIDLMLMDYLGLQPSTQRFVIGFMGCFGAFRALAMASALAEQDDKNRILIVCAELCSLHIQPSKDLGTIIGNMLFADGVAAMVVGGSPREGENPLWQIIKSASIVISNSPSLITWDVSDQGFVMHLSNKVPEYIGSGVRAFAQSLMGDVSFELADWPVHPGGKSILTAIESACGLSPEQTKASWAVLAEYGNMSSATVPFVLERLLKQSQRKPWAVSLGFGPGVSIDGVLLKSCV